MKLRTRHTLWALFVSFGIFTAAGTTEVSARSKSTCVPRIDNSESIRIIHDPYGAANTNEPFEIKISNAGGITCTGRLRISSASPTPFLTSTENDQRVRYSLFDEHLNRNVTPPEPNSTNFAQTVTVVPGQISAIPYVFSVHPGEDLSAGEYIRYVTFDYIVGTRSVLATRTLPVILEVRPTARIGLKGEFTRVGGMRTIDLGELENRIYRPHTYVTVDATRGYTLSITSENLGRLKHDDPSWSLPYQLSLDNMPVDLTGRFQHIRLSKKAVNDQYPLIFSVQDTDRKRAGRYSDILHFTVSSL